ncbi:hypothetical protein TRVL_10273 [Trypanosoma vivax]|nr:hypothetical protein TRVL_10273 [Trypanosoma vivax]
MKLDMVQEYKPDGKNNALNCWRRRVLADTALGKWKDNVPKLSTTESASWNLETIYAPQPVTSPVLAVDGHPLTKQQHTQALSRMYMAGSTKATHATEMKIPSTRHSTFQHITYTELEHALRQLSSGTLLGDDEIHCEELSNRGRVLRKCILCLFNFSLRAGQGPANR